jgi:hypothetical protein
MNNINTGAPAYLFIGKRSSDSSVTASALRSAPRVAQKGKHGGRTAKRRLDLFPYPQLRDCRNSLTYLAGIWIPKKILLKNLLNALNFPRAHRAGACQRWAVKPNLLIQEIADFVPN